MMAKSFKRNYFVGTVDVVVTDTLTGNILMKMFSSFTSGGQYEVSGYGYGPE